MANVLQWEAVWSNEGTFLTTQLNSLGIGTVSSLGTEFTNNTGLDMWGKVEVYLNSLSPTSGAYLEVHMCTAPDGTNYEDAPGANNPSMQTIADVMSIDTTASAVKRAMSRPFLLQPGKTKFAIKNGCGVALASANNTLKLYSTNEEIQ